jgi:hypothetical protein
MTNIIKYEDFFSSIEESAYEIFIETEGEINEAGSNIETALKNKAKKTGMPLGILRQVYNVARVPGKQVTSQEPLLNNGEWLGLILLQQVEKLPKWGTKPFISRLRKLKQLKRSKHG